MSTSQGAAEAAGRDGAPSGTQAASSSGRQPAAETPPLVMLVIGEARCATGRSPVQASDLNAHAGMAGSGKTTLLQRINTYLHEKGRPGYLLNLDPAVADTPYEPNIDIRDTVRTHAQGALECSHAD